jgi:hypothetical protein
VVSARRSAYAHLRTVIEQQESEPSAAGKLATRRRMHRFRGLALFGWGLLLGGPVLAFYQGGLPSTVGLVIWITGLAIVAVTSVQLLRLSRGSSRSQPTA